MKPAHLPLGLVAALAVSCSSSTVSSESKPDLTTVEVRESSPVRLEESGANTGEFQVVCNMLEHSSFSAILFSGSPFTILATSDESLQSMDSEMLGYATDPKQLDSVMGFHVLPGKLTAHQLSKFTRLETLGGQRLHVSTWNGSVEISGSGSRALGLDPARIVQPDLLVGDGILHILDGFALPSTQTIGEIVQTSTALTQLNAAAEFAGVSGLLKDKGPMTVFAPTEQAFAALDSEVRERLLDPRNRAELFAVLQRHVLPGRLYSDQFHTGTMTGYGESELEFTWSSSGFFVEGARIVHTDVEATNGVVHLIDRLLVD